MTAIRQRKSAPDVGYIRADPSKGSFLMQKLPALPAAPQAFAETLSRGRSVPDVGKEQCVQSEKIKVDIAIEEAFFPTAHEILAARELVTNIEHVTRAKGKSLIEVSQTHALVTRNSLFGTYDVRPANPDAAHRRVMTVCAPWSMEGYRLFYATRSLYRKAIPHEEVIEFNERGDLISTPVNITQIPLLIVRMPVRPGLRALCFSVLDAIDEATGSNVFYEEVRRQRSTAAWVINLRRWLSGLNIGTVAIVGMNSTHAKANGFPEFLAGLNEIVDTTGGLALSMSPALYHGIAETELDLLCPTPPIQINGYAASDCDALARHCWALLGRPEPMPDAMVAAIRSTYGQRQWIKLVLRELNRRLTGRRKLPDELFTRLVDRACAGVAKQRGLWNGLEIDSATAARLRDWIPLEWSKNRKSKDGKLLPLCAPEKTGDAS